MIIIINIEFLSINGSCTMPLISDLSKKDREEIMAMLNEEGLSFQHPIDLNEQPLPSSRFGDITLLSLALIKGHYELARRLKQQGVSLIYFNTNTFERIMYRAISPFDENINNNCQIIFECVNDLAQWDPRGTLLDYLNRTALLTITAAQTDDAFLSGRFIPGKNTTQEQFMQILQELIKFIYKKELLVMKKNESDIIAQLSDKFLKGVDATIVSHAVASVVAAGLKKYSAVEHSDAYWQAFINMAQSAIAKEEQEKKKKESVGDNESESTGVTSQYDAQRTRPKMAAEAGSAAEATNLHREEEERRNKKRTIE